MAKRVFAWVCCCCGAADKVMAGSFLAAATRLLPPCDCGPDWCDDCAACGTHCTVAPGRIHTHRPGRGKVPPGGGR